MRTQNYIRTSLWEIYVKLMDAQRIFDSIDPEDFTWDDDAEYGWHRAEFKLRDAVLELDRVAHHVKAISDEKKRAREMNTGKD